MKRFDDSLKEGYAKITHKNMNRVKSRIRSSERAIKVAQLIPLETDSLGSIFRELYEGLRQFCEAIGFAKGFQFRSHEVISVFLADFLKEEKIAQQFDRYRRLRNGINYYGEEIDINTVKKALQDVPKMIDSLKKYLQ